MKKKTMLSWSALIYCLCAASLSWAASSSVSPSSVYISRGQNALSTLTYQFSGYAGIVNSSAGSFSAGGTMIATNDIPLSVNLNASAVAGSGRVSETVNIPVRIIEKALQLGLNTFTYTRTFRDFAGAPINFTVTYTITSEAAAPFAIRNIKLYFENRRAETTIPKHSPIKAFVDITYLGSGLLEGYWEVDGRIMAYVSRHLSFGQTMTLPSPQVPAFPTFDPGTHIVRFVVTKPLQPLPLPSIVYFVTLEEASPLNIKLLTPADQASLAYAPQGFEWEKFDGAELFLIQYFDQSESKSIFSAYTRKPGYRIPEIALKRLFLPDRRYSWKVSGFDPKNRMVGESPLWKFRFQSPSPAVK